MESLWRGFESRPNDPVLFARLRESLEQEGDFAGLIQLYTQRAKAVGGEEAVFLYLTVAEVWAEQQSDQDTARQAYQHIRGLMDGFEQEARAQIHKTLEKLYWARNDWLSLRDLMEAKAQSAATPAHRAQAWLKLGELNHTKRHDIPGAAQAYLKAAQETEGGRQAQARRA
ncbi:MAG: hypothetical protein AAFS10_28205, partial [Myxococcota bacterium]